jgi:hypothetical protein
MNRPVPATRRINPEAVEERMEAVAWGLILMVTGGALMLPGWTVPVGGWLASIGLIFLGLNLARHWKGIETRRLTTLLGILALAAAAGVFLGLDLLIFPILLLAVGAYIIARQFTAARAGGAG